MSYHSPQSDKNAPPSNRQTLIVVSLLIGGIALIFWLLGLLLNGIVLVIPPAVEQKLGELIVPVYEQQAKASPTQTTLNQLLDHLETHLPENQQQRDYQILYVPQETVNALAIPGDRIIIYQGLLEEVESENELMMVLGHELGHFAHRDHLRGIGNALLIRIAIDYFFGDLGVFQGAVTTSVQAIANAQYSQLQEKQADVFGLQLLNQTYGHVAGATDFFARLSQKKDQSISFLSSHPAPRKRVKEINKLIKQNNYPIKERSPLPATFRH